MIKTGNSCLKDSQHGLLQKVKQKFNFEKNKIRKSKYVKVWNCSVEQYLEKSDN